MHKLIVLLFFLLGSSHGFSQESLSHFTPEYFEQQRFAHRGGYANGPENTLATILFNIKNGVRAFEIDVQMTKDKELVVFHDQKINRILNCNTALRVDELTLEQLKEIRLRDTTKGLQYVCSLRELVDTLVRLIPRSEIKDFIIEVDFKPHGKATKEAVSALGDIVNSQLDHLGEKIYNSFFISTFYPEVLKEVYLMNPKIVRAFAVNNNPDDNKLLARLAILLAPSFIKKYKVKIIEPNICMVDNKFIQKWHKKGILINAYTANTSCEKDYLDPLKIAYTTNCPEGICEKKASDQVSSKVKWCKRCSTDSD
jgi:glycerophosphoryl diester phosphodiesterase